MTSEPMPRDGLDTSALQAETSAKAMDAAVEAFTPYPELESAKLSTEDESDYKAIGAAVLLIASLCAFITIAYGTEAGMSLAQATFLAVCLTTVLFAFGLALVTFRKLPFTIGLAVLGVILLGATLALAADLFSGGTASGVTFPESTYVSPEGALVFGAVFGAGCLLLAARMARARKPFYGLR